MRVKAYLSIVAGLVVLTGAVVQAEPTQPVDSSSSTPGVRMGQFPLAAAPGPGLPFELDTTSMKDADQNNPGNEWVVAPIPFVNPLVGTGLAGGAAYIYHPSGEDKKLPPWTTGCGGFYSDSKSWAAAVFHKMNLCQDSWRLSGALGYGQLNYDFYGIGDKGASDQLVSLSQTVGGGLAEGLYRIREHLYTGINYSLAKVDTSYPTDTLPPWISEITSLGQLSTVLSIPSLRMQWDTRNDTFLPTHGSLLDCKLSLSDTKFGSDFTFQTLLLTAKHYWKLSDQQTLAVYGYGRFAYGDVPFFELSMIGSNGNLRGYPVGRYQDRMAMTGQVEYRWQAWRRLGLVAFGGLGAVAPEWGEFRHATALPSIGGGVRYLLTEKNKVNFRLDVAWGRDERLVYLGVGEAF